jgi:hypothetical protein
VPTLYLKIERELIIYFKKLLVDVILENACKICTKIIAAILNIRDVIILPFLYSYFSKNDNLVLTTAPHCKGIDFEAYLEIITNIP